MSPVGAGDAPYLYISTSPGGLLPSPQLHVTPSQLKLDWKAGPKRPETGVTAGVREGGGENGGERWKREKTQRRDKENQGGELQDEKEIVRRGGREQG